MKKETTPIARMTSALQEWESSEQRQVSSYEYEKTFVEMWRKLGTEIFQQSMGELPSNRNLKKTSNQSRKGGSSKATYTNESGREI